MSPDATACTLHAAGPARASRREWLGLVVLALPCVLYAMDLTVLHVALPRLGAALHPTSAQLLWIIDIYGFVVAGLLIPMGALGDRVGRRRVLLVGAAAFGAVSVLASLAPNAATLIAARAALGVAGATLAPSTLSLLRVMFRDPAERAAAIAVWIASYSVGGAIGPVVGGLLLEHFRWGAVFLIGVPVMGVVLTLGPVLLPEFRQPAAGRIDFASAGQWLTAVLLVIFGVKRAAQGGTATTPALAIAAGVGVAFVFVRRQRTLATPLIDLGLLADRAFTVTLVAYALAAFVSFGVLLFVGQDLQLVLGLTPLRAGLSLLPFFLGFVVGALATPRLARRARPATVMTLGLCLSAVGLALLARVGTPAGVRLVMVACTTVSLGLSPVFMLAADLVVGAAAPERAGAAAALSETASELGGALGIAALGSAGTAVYRATMTQTIPRGLTSASAAVARGSLGGATAVARGLHGDAAVALLRAAGDAFRQSLACVAALSAALVLAAALAMARTPRPAPD